MGIGCIYMKNNGLFCGKFTQKILDKVWVKKYTPDKGFDGCASSKILLFRTCSPFGVSIFLCEVARTFFWTRSTSEDASK